MKRIFSIIILFVLSAASIRAQVVISSRFKPFTYEEMVAPLVIAQQAYNEVMSAIDDLTEYIMDILASDIDTQLRNEINVEYKAILDVSKKLENTGNLNNARSEYNRIRNSVRQKVVNYYNRIAQARQSAAQEQNPPRTQATNTTTISKSREKSSNSNSKNIKIKIGEQTTLYIDSSEPVWWESDNPDIATITKDGLIEGISRGHAFVWAHIGDHVKLYNVYVYPADYRY